ncbi:MAG: hypothetical protein J1E32_09105, partial [Treponema sp.]|nr:hypothetical protein [Treponema sp.]
MLKKREISGFSLILHNILKLFKERKRPFSLFRRKIIVKNEPVEPHRLSPHTPHNPRDGVVI